LDPAELLNASLFKDRLAAWNSVAAPATVYMKGLLDLPEDQRWAVLDFFSILNRQPRYVTRKDSRPSPDLLDAVLSLMRNGNDLVRQGAVKMAALEVAVLRHPDALEAACGKIMNRMRECGVPGVRVESLLRDARTIAKQSKRYDKAGQDGIACQTVQEVLPQAPVPKETKIPGDWSLTEAGVRSSREEVFGEIPAPVVIAGRGKDSTRGVEHLCLAWFRDGVWHRRIVEREVTANAQKILGLAAYGLPVTSNNARLVIQYLADFETANVKHLPIANVSRKLGYQGADGKLGFLWGRTLITAQGVQGGGDLNQIDPNEWSHQAVHFQGADEGDDQIAAGFHAAGTYKGWRRAVQSVKPFPKVKFSFYAGLTAPLLPILRAPNIIVDDAGETTNGKTTAMRVGVSSFGNPDEESNNGKPPALFTWKGTVVWKERAPAVVNHLPFAMDDTKHVKHKEDVAETIYLIAQGRGKGRGSVKGTAAQDTFSTVMLSSGEQPATSFTEDGGTRARVITVWGSPFGVKSPENGRLVRRLNTQLKRHYGHAGPRFVHYLLKNRARWKKWRERYQDLIEMWEDKAGDNAIAGRLAACFAAISVTAILAHEALDLPWEHEDPVEPLWHELVREATDRASAALRHVMDWAIAHEGEFFGRRDPKLGSPTQGWAGRWDRVPSDDKHRNWSWIAFSPLRLNAVLQDDGFEPNSTIRSWRDRGWLRTEKDQDGTSRTHCRMRMGEENSRLIVVTGEGVKAAEEAS
jgi:hypothetical protein